jgi:hypothetical protein
MRNLGILLAAFLSVAIALTSGWAQEQQPIGITPAPQGVLELLCECSCGSFTGVLVQPRSFGDELHCPENESCNICGAPSTLTGCFGTNRSRRDQISCPAGSPGAAGGVEKSGSSSGKGSR